MLYGWFPLGHCVHHADNFGTAAKLVGQFVRFLAAVNNIAQYMGIGDAAVLFNYKLHIYLAFDIFLDSRLGVSYVSVQKSKHRVNATRKLRFALYNIENIRIIRVAPGIIVGVNTTCYSEGAHHRAQQKEFFHIAIHFEINLYLI